MASRFSDRQFDAICMRLAVRAARESVNEDEKPHPRVGVIVAKNGEILAIAHRGETSAGEHAEYIALEKKLARDAIAGATVYTTLEPCAARNHSNRSCVQTLIDRRVGRVFIGMLDPDPEARGLGSRQLEKAGIAVEPFPQELVEELLDLNRHFIRARDSEPAASEAFNPQEESSDVDLLGTWFGFWKNPDGRSGEEVIHIIKREGDSFVGSFSPKDSPEAPVVFEGTFRNPYVRVHYHAPYSASEGKGVMEDGACFLKLREDGSMKGYYAGFDSHGEYELGNAMSFARKFGWPEPARAHPAEATRVEPSRKLKVFIAYATEDASRAGELYTWLVNKGIDAWLAPKRILGGQVWKEQTEKAIQASDAFLALLSTRSVTKQGRFQSELKKAVDIESTMPEGRIYLIPIRLDDCRVPSKLEDIHCIDSFKPGDFGEIAASLRACAEYIGVALDL